MCGLYVIIPLQVNCADISRDWEVCERSEEKVKPVLAVYVYGCEVTLIRPPSRALASAAIVFAVEAVLQTVTGDNSPDIVSPHVQVC